MEGSTILIAVKNEYAGCGKLIAKEGWFFKAEKLIPDCDNQIKVINVDSRKSYFLNADTLRVATEEEIQEMYKKQTSC